MIWRKIEMCNLWCPDFMDSQTQPAKSLKSNTGGMSFCWNGIQYARPYSQKYTPPYCFFCNFASWVVIKLTFLFLCFTEKICLITSQPAKLQKKQCGGVYFWLYGIAYWTPIQQKLPPPVLLFRDFAGCHGLLSLLSMIKLYRFSIWLIPFILTFRLNLFWFLTFFYFKMVMVLI